MQKERQRRLITVLFLLGGLTVSVLCALLALSQHMHFFFTPTQLKEEPPPSERVVRVGGMVLKGSVVRLPDLRVEFYVTDFHNHLKVHYQGILPDLFREEQGVVILGTLTPQGELFAKNVLAKHDERYMPPEIRHLVKNVP